MTAFDNPPLSGRRVGFVFVGGELLTGDTTNTSAGHLAKLVVEAGYTVVSMATVDDRLQDIAQTLTAIQANGKVDIAVVSGGLGPTSDDLTLAAAASGFGLPLVEDSAHADYLEKFFHRREAERKAKMEKAETLPLKEAKAGGEQHNELSIDLKQRIRSQASVPQGAAVVTHRFGTAPLVVLERGKTVFFFLAGVPYEALSVMRSQVLPRLQARKTAETAIDRHEEKMVVLGEVESRLEEIVLALAFAKKVSFDDRGVSEENRIAAGSATSAANTPFAQQKKLGVSYLPQGGKVVRLSFYGADKALLSGFTAALKATFTARPQLLIYSGKLSVVEKLHATLLQSAQVGGALLCLGESCTAGGVAQAIAAHPKASHYFSHSLVTYSNQAKQRFLNVGEDTLEKLGAVSKQTASEMLTGLSATMVGQQALKIAVVITGIAGPDGGSEQKPVGTVWIGYEMHYRKLKEKPLSLRKVERYAFSGDRRNVQERTKTKVFVELLFMLRQVGVLQTEG